MCTPHQQNPLHGTPPLKSLATSPDGPALMHGQPQRMVMHGNTEKVHPYPIAGEGCLYAPRSGSPERVTQPSEFLATSPDSPANTHGHSYKAAFQTLMEVCAHSQWLSSQRCQSRPCSWSACDCAGEGCLHTPHIGSPAHGTLPSVSVATSLGSPAHMHGQTLKTSCRHASKIFGS